VTDDPVGVLDTSTLVLIDRLDPAALPAEPVITAVTLAELSVGPLVATRDAERVAGQVRLQQAEASFEPLPFDARRPGHLAALPLRCAGRAARPQPVPLMQ
jgi:tRNA(fMet)-specific endonuclease VapC